MSKNDGASIRRRVGISAGTVAAVLVMVLAMAAAAGIGPRIAADQVRYEFGSVKAGGRVEHLFAIRNVGDQVLKITKVQSS